MEPITILIYLSIFFLAILGIELFIALYYIIRISKKVDKVTNFIDGISGIFQTIENIPAEIFKMITKKFF